MDAKGITNTLDYRTKAILIGLRLEVRTNGRMRMTGKAPTCYSIVKREYGFKGNRASVLAQFERFLGQDSK